MESGTHEHAKVYCGVGARTEFTKVSLPANVLTMYSKEEFGSCLPLMSTPKYFNDLFTNPILMFWRSSEAFGYAPSKDDI